MLISASAIIPSFAVVAPKFIGCRTENPTHAIQLPFYAIAEGPIAAAFSDDVFVDSQLRNARNCIVRDKLLSQLFQVLPLGCIPLHKNRDTFGNTTGHFQTIHALTVLSSRNYDSTISPRSLISTCLTACNGTPSR